MSPKPKKKAQESSEKIAKGMRDVSDEMDKTSDDVATDIRRMSRELENLAHRLELYVKSVGDSHE